MVKIINNDMRGQFWGFDSYRIGIEPDGWSGARVSLWAYEKDGLYPFNRPTPIFRTKLFYKEYFTGWRKLLWPLYIYNNWSVKRQVYNRIWEHEIHIAQLRKDVTKRYQERVWGEDES